MATETEGATGPAAVSAEEVLDGLNDLLQLDHDAIGAYQVALERLRDVELAGQVEAFLRDHERHVQELTGLIQGLGGAPRNEPHATGPFKQALQGIGSLGGDRGTLMAFRTNELQVRMKYRKAAARAGSWPDEVRTTVERNALDEERHYRWVSMVLEEMGRAGEGGAAQQVADGLGAATGFLRGVDPAELRGGLEGRLRASPARTLIFAFAAGYMAGRILR